MKLTLDGWDRLGRNVPTIVDLLIHRGAMTVNGDTIWENCKTASIFNPEVINRRVGAPSALRITPSIRARPL